MPRPEDIPPAEAAVEEAQARLNDAEAAYNRDRAALPERKMIAASDYDKDRYACYAAKAALAKAEADLAKLKAGTWKEDIDVASGRRSQAAQPGREHQDQARPADRPAPWSTARSSRSTSGPASSPPWPGRSR